MKNEYEFVPHKRVRNINLIVNKINYRSFHMHNDLELIYVLDGSGVVNTRNEHIILKKGSLVILNSYQEHEIDAHVETLTAIFIQITNHLLRKFLNHSTNVYFKRNDIAANIPCEKADEIKKRIISAAITYFKQEDFFVFDFVSDISRIISILFTEMPIEIIDEKDYNNWKKQANRIGIVVSYIEENYLIPVHLDDISALIGVTPTYLSHLFIEYVGISFQEYLNTLRFEHAIILIANSKSSVSLTKIAELSGFSKLKYMNQMFEKKLGMKAKDYRIAITNDVNVQNSQNFLEHIFDEKKSLQFIYSLDDTDEKS